MLVVTLCTALLCCLAMLTASAVRGAT